MLPLLDTVISVGLEQLESISRRASLGALLALCVVGTRFSRGRTTANEGRTVSARRSAPEPQRPHRLSWSYRRFNTWDYAGSAAVSLAGLYLEFGIDRDFPDGSWDNGILFDDAVRGALVASSRAGRNRAAALSDYFW